MAFYKAYIEKSNMEEFIIVPKTYMSFLACWPFRKSKYSWLLHIYAFLTAYLISLLFLISLTIGIYINLGDLGLVADASYFFLTEFCFMIKFSLFTSKRKMFLSILDNLEDPIFMLHSKEQKRYLHSWSRLSRAYSHVFFISCLLFLVMNGFNPMLDKGEDNILPFRAWLPFDVKTNLYFRGIVYVFQLLGLLFAIFINASLDLLPSIFMNIACAQIQILKDNLEGATQKAETKLTKINKDFENNEYKKEFGENYYEMLSDDANEIVHDILSHCVEHHEAIISFLKKVEKMFSAGMLAQFIESGITICITGFQLIVVPGKSIKYIAMIVYLIALGFQISLYCWNGHQVTLLSSSIGDSCYNMAWYRCNTKVKKSIFIIMERCKRPFNMTAGGYFTLSISTLTAILRSSYSYFAVLQRVYKK